MQLVNTLSNRTNSKYCSHAGLFGRSGLVGLSEGLPGALLFLLFLGGPSSWFSPSFSWAAPDLVSGFEFGLPGADGRGEAGLLIPEVVLGVWKTLLGGGFMVDVRGSANLKFPGSPTSGASSMNSLFCFCLLYCWKDSKRACVSADVADLAVWTDCVFAAPV